MFLNVFYSWLIALPIYSENRIPEDESVFEPRGDERHEN
jgi:hypothetical protein